MMSSSKPTSESKAPKVPLCWRRPPVGELTLSEVEAAYWTLRRMLIVVPHAERAALVEASNVLNDYLSIQGG